MREDTGKSQDTAADASSGRPDPLTPDVTRPARRPPSQGVPALPPAVQAPAPLDDFRPTLEMSVVPPAGRPQMVPPPARSLGHVRAPQPVRVTRLDWTAGKPLSGRYVMVDKLGEGGMGTVYLAEDLLLRHKVAVKALWDEDLFEQADIERFRKEVSLAHTVSHPNIARTYDLGETGGVHFITMEYLRGKTLMQRIQDGPLLTSAEVMTLAVPLCHGLRAAHKAGVVHRDLKPANIMLTGDERKLAIMDFGVAALMGDALDSPSMTMRPGNSQRSANKWEVTSAGLGTPVYMAPEQWDQRTGDQRTDIYALGVILYACLTGQAPYFAEEVEELGRLHRTAPIPDVAKVVKACDPVLARLIALCLAKRPEDRPQSMDEVLAILEGPSRRRRYVAELAIGVVTSAAALFLIGFAVYYLVASALVAEMRPSMRRLAELTAARLQIADLDQIKTPADIGSPAFLRVKQAIDVVRRANPEARYFYVLRAGATINRWNYVYDLNYQDRDINGNGRIDPDTDEEGDTPGEPMDGAPFPRMAEARRTGTPQADDAFLQDDWRVVLSGYAPLPAGQPNATYLVGVDATSEPLSNLRRGLAIVLGAAEVIVVGLLAWLLAPQRRLLRALRRERRRTMDAEA